MKLEWQIIWDYLNQYSIVSRVHKSGRKQRFGQEIHHGKKTKTVVGRGPTVRLCPCWLYTWKKD
jgi:hypothetical protein